MKILYAVCGEGMGHAIRSKVVIQHLVKNHEVTVVSSGRAFSFLDKNFDDVHEGHYYHIIYRDNAVDYFRTLLSNVKTVPTSVPKAFYRIVSLIRSRKPDIIITDFEPFSDFVAKLFRIPVIAVDNITMLVRGNIEKDVGDFFDYILARSVARSFVIRPRKYLISTFFYPEKKKQRGTIFVPPVIRPEIISTKISDKGHILVYQTSSSYSDMLDMIKAYGKKKDQKFIVYGFDKECTVGQVNFRKFSEQGFIDDLASCRGVIVNGGFTVLCEAIYLHKPVLSIPVAHQFEQIMNSQYVHRLGYGMSARSLDEDVLSEFISSLDKFRNNLAEYAQEGNNVLFHELDETLKDIIKIRRNCPIGNFF
ncbi:teichoic acid biosynthesis protein [Candidatus Woesearchaeota archaeon]|nr:teichoic acid biosynthesis protein [Candidatus Woesearchaeota archaeon]